MVTSSDKLTYQTALDTEDLDPEQIRAELRKFVNFVLEFEQRQKISPWKAVASIDLNFAQRILDQVHDFQRTGREIRQLSQSLGSDDWRRVYTRWSLQKVMLAATAIANHRAHTFRYDTE